MGAPEDGRIGIWMTSALVVGTMIGAGIFMLPVSLAPLGRNALVGWFLSSVGALTIAFALARLSQLGGDGIQANIERQLGRNVAFLVAWSFWVSNLAAQAAVAIAGASALSWINPAFAGPGFVIPAAIGSVAFFTAVNAFGVRASGVASIVTVVIRLLPLAGVILIFALRGIGSSAYEPLAPMALTPGNIATATALTFYALTGFENATTPVDKVRDPARTVPRAIIGGTLFVAIVYFLASTSLQMLLPAAKVAGSPAPFAGSDCRPMGRGQRVACRARHRDRRVRLPQRPYPWQWRACLRTGPETRLAGRIGVDLEGQHARCRADRRFGAVGLADPGQ